MSTLILSHSIFLTKEERYNLCKNIELDVVGVNIPVLINNESVAKPAKEIFYRYILKCGKKKDILFKDNYFTIILPPQRNYDLKKILSNDDWKKMTEDQLQVWYEKYKFISVEQLLDLKDGGANGYMSFICQKEINNQRSVNFIEIKPMECLLNSLV